MMILFKDVNSLSAEGHPVTHDHPPIERLTLVMITMQTRWFLRTPILKNPFSGMLLHFAYSLKSFPLTELIVSFNYHVFGWHATMLRPVTILFPEDRHRPQETQLV